MKTRTLPESYKLGQPMLLVSVSGFSLIELMITIAILGVVASLAAPSFRDLIASQRLRATTSALTESIWLARSEALKRNTPVGFAFTSVSSGWVVMAGTTTLYSQDGFSSVTSGAGDFQFNAYGRMPATISLQLSVVSAGLYRCLTASTAGKVTERVGSC